MVDAANTDAQGCFDIGVFVNVGGEMVDLDRLVEDAQRYRKIRDILNAETLCYIANNAETSEEFDDLVDDLLDVTTTVARDV